MPEPPNPFWDYSLTLWGNERARAALMRLQDRNAARTDVDVNILLFCVWVASTGYGELNAGEILGAISATKPWHDAVVLPLRTTRRSLTEGVDPVSPALGTRLLAAVGKAELEAEKVEQLMLAHLVDIPEHREAAPKAAADAATSSYSRYFLRLEITPTEADNRDMGQLLAVAFPGGGDGNESIEK